MARAISLTAEVTDVLRRSTVEGCVLRLPGDKLARPTYEAVNKIIVAIGGKWDRHTGGHVFGSDPSDKIAEAIGGGSVENRKQALQFFETPVGLADRLVSKLGRIEDAVCLEPSAGRGRIVQALAMRDPRQVIAVEIDADNGGALTKQGQAHDIIVGDFLELRPAVLSCDFVAMNPPFARNQDIKHVRHAFECLRAGGTLAAIVSEHGFIGQERECVEWREWLAANDAEIEVIPAGAFKESGTGIQTRMIVVRKSS